MLLFLTDKLFPKCILSPCLSQGRERGRRRGAGDPFSHWEGNIHLWAACKDKVVHRSGRQGSPIPTGCAGRWRWCQKLHYLPNAASLSHMAKFPLGLYLIKTNQSNKQKSMNTTKQTQQATEEWAEGFISVCYLDAFKQAALAIICRGTGQLPGSLKEHGARAGAVSPPQLHLLVPQGRIYLCRTPKFSSCGDSKAPVPGPGLRSWWSGSQDGGSASCQCHPARCRTGARGTNEASHAHMEGFPAPSDYKGCLAEQESVCLPCSAQTVASVNTSHMSN